MRSFCLVTVVAVGWLIGGCSQGTPQSGLNGPSPSTKPATAGTLTDGDITAVRPAATQPASAPSPAEARKKARLILELSLQVDKLYKEKKYDQCLPVQEQLVQLSDSGVDWYNLACILSLMNQPDFALDALERSIDKGYAQIRHMELDKDLDNLRQTSRYKSIIIRRDAIQRDRAQKVVEGLRKELGASYKYQINHDQRLVFAYALDEKTAGEINAYLSRFAEAMSKTLFTHALDQYVAVVIPDANHPRQPHVGGYFNPNQKMLVAYSTGMVLTHEFTHALHNAQQEALGQQHPIWVVEGLATLFETSEIRDGQALPLPNGRLNHIQALIRKKRQLSLQQLAQVDHAQFMQQAAIAYPQSRYMLMYLAEMGLLKAWYNHYVESFKIDPTGLTAMEAVTGKTVAALEADWKLWVMAQTPLKIRVEANQAYMGVQVTAVVDGLRVVRVVPGSGAQEAGLIAGDVIVKLANKRMVDPEDLTLTVTASQTGQKLAVEFRRESQYKKVQVTLKPMPPPLVQGPAQTRPATRPATQPSTRPTTREATGSTTRSTTWPATRPAAQPTTRPATGKAQGATSKQRGSL